MKSKFLTVASVLALGLTVAATASANEHEAKKEEGKVKCAGNVKAGKNDCKTAAHSCAGQAKKDNDPAEWAFVASEADCAKAGGKVAK